MRELFFQVEAAHGSCLALNGLSLPLPLPAHGPSRGLLFVFTRGEKNGRQEMEEVRICELSTILVFPSVLNSNVISPNVNKCYVGRKSIQNPIHLGNRLHSYAAFLFQGLSESLLS